ncbi:MAG TPA: glycerophosphodiester phosphodiesterase family protein [Verrucomicrobiae bacterium]
MLSIEMNAGAETVAEKLLNEKRPLVIAHRGYSMVAPENTLAAFELGIAAGADLIELDYHHSKDGIPVVMHDYTLDRTTDATNKLGGSRIRVDAQNAGDFTKLDAGSWFNLRFSAEKPPLLSEALEFIQKKGVTLIERKAGDAKTCVEMLRSKNLVNALIVQAFDWDYLADFHRLEPAQVLGTLGPPSTKDGKKLSDDEKKLSPAWIDAARKCGARAVVWSRSVDKSAIDYAHSKGLKVWVYTINEPGLANQLLDAGVNGIITDNPALIWRTMALRAGK